MRGIAWHGSLSVSLRLDVMDVSPHPQLAVFDHSTSLLLQCASNSGAVNWLFRSPHEDPTSPTWRVYGSGQLTAGIGSLGFAERWFLDQPSLVPWVLPSVAESEKVKPSIDDIIMIPVSRDAVPRCNCKHHDVVHFTLNYKKLALASENENLFSPNTHKGRHSLLGLSFAQLSNFLVKIAVYFNHFQHPASWELLLLSQHLLLEPVLSLFEVKAVALVWLHLAAHPALSVN